MKLNSTVRTTLIATSLALISGSVFAAPVTIPVAVTFDGVVRDDTCATTVVGTGGTVDLGIISNGSFSGAGSTGPEKNFNIQLSGCGAGLASTLDVWFGGANDDTATSSLKNMTGSANIGVQVLPVGGTALAPNNAASTASFTGLVAGAPNTLTLTARTVQVGATTPTAGNLSVPGTLNIVYP